MRKEYWLLLLILVIAGFLRLWDLPNIPPGLYPDEAMNGNNALESLATSDWKVFYPENNGREGLFINIQSISLKFFGNEPWALRLPSALFGILTVLGVYFLTKELFRNSNFEIRASDVALLAAFLLATSFWHINFSRIGFRAIMAPFFLTWGVYLLLLAFSKIQNLKIKNQNHNSKLKIFLLATLAGAIYGLGMHSYIAYRATPLLILLIIPAYWFKNKNSEIRKRILLASCFMILASIIVFAPLGLHFLQNPADFFGRTTEISIFKGPSPVKDLTINTLKTLGMFNFAGDYNWRHNFSGAPELFWPVGIMFLVGFFMAIKRIFHFPFSILISWIIVTALPVIISNEGLPHALRAILMIPPVFILASVGGVSIYNFFNARTSDVPNITLMSGRRTSRDLILKTASLLLLLFILLNSYFMYFIRWAENPNTADAFAQNYLEVGRKLNALPLEQPKYVIVNARGVDVRGIPMPAQTVMFLTDTFTPEKQAKKNIHYLLPSEVNKIEFPESAYITELN